MVPDGLELTHPDAKARAAFRRNLAAASPNWCLALLECPSPGCANHVTARWTDGRLDYWFNGFRHPKGVGGGGFVAVHAMSPDGRELVSYCIRSDGTVVRATVSNEVRLDLPWADRRERDFFAATPVNN
jgi:hypothetical protein